MSEPENPQQTFPKGLTVGELRAKLAEFPQDARVLTSVRMDDAVSDLHSITWWPGSPNAPSEVWLEADY